MRTTITLAPDVAAEVERLRREEGLGPSEAVNRLARQGIAPSAERAPYVPVTWNAGLLVDVANVGEVLDLLDQEDA